ncbi:uracil-DNA glycosylase-like [Physella acuta]|uniref:uracil-DNA glycosylase-like n=1 Tax=Physella acuta TaxID=109671 RepID=UPI0027DE8B69|nr:uracil-DNA glycosylase-like [Physella acuta]
MVFLFFARLLSARYRKSLKTMPSQTKISSFFRHSPSAAPAFQDKNTCPNSSNENTDKKVKGQIEEEEIKEPAVKKVKLSESSEKQSCPVELSENDRKRVEQNKLAAKMKLIGGKTGGLVQNVGHSWFTALEPEFSKEYFIKLGTFIAEERKKGTVYPPPEQVFSWTRTCRIDSVKVVIIGQDPYHGPRQAHGLCFSVLPGVKPPPSLENMFKELESSIEGFKRPGHGNLIGWANQGVLLLNACLTVRASQANSHADKGWEKFTDAVIQWLNLNLSGLVFMLWGAYAHKKGACINTKKHHILKSVHPSPLSAHRDFLGCRHFALCNELLSSAGKSQIDWTHLPEREEESLK